MHKFFQFFKEQKTQKILVIILLLFLLAAIPLTVWFSAQQQVIRQRAATKVWAGGIDTCGHVKVAFLNESPSCPSGTNVATDTYTTTVQMVSNDGGTYQVNYLFESFWCKDSSELGDGVNPTSCIKRSTNHVASKTVTVGPGAGVSVTSITQQASSYGFGSSCGIYQTDFSFTINGTSCHFGYSALDTNPQHPVLAAGYCNTGQVCTVPTATPTPTTPVSPTATSTPAPTATPGPTSTPTPTPTPGPTATPGPTSTPAPTATPGPTTVVTPTPKPTLPATGPGNTIVGVGILGVAAATIGTLVMLLL